MRIFVILYCRKDPSSENCSVTDFSARLFHQVFISFRKFCAKSSTLPPELHILFSDIASNGGHVDDLFPYFLRHAKQCFPHLECMDDLRKISDLRSPANWYPEARNLQRKVVFHAGPTNSGKTYEAMEYFLKAKTGIYCGPLKLLANEVFNKANAKVCYKGSFADRSWLFSGGSFVVLYISPGCLKSAVNLCSNVISI